MYPAKLVSQSGLSSDRRADVVALNRVRSCRDAKDLDAMADIASNDVARAWGCPADRVRAGANNRDASRRVAQRVGARRVHADIIALHQIVGRTRAIQ